MSDPSQLQSGRVVVTKVMSLDTSTGTFQSGGHSFLLTPTETQLLAALLREPGRVVTRTDLMIAAWGQAGFPEERLTDVISALRAKLAPCEVSIRSMPGIGYVLE